MSSNGDSSGGYAYVVASPHSTTLVALCFVLAARGEATAESPVSDPAASATSSAAVPGSESDPVSGATATSSSIVPGTESDTVSPTVPLCVELQGPVPVDGPVSADPVVAAEQRFRAELGLRSDIAWVEEVLAMEFTFGRIYKDGRITDEELAELENRRDLGPALEAVRAYGADYPEGFAGVWVNPKQTIVTVAFTEPSTSHETALLDLLPADVALELAPVRFSTVHLEAAVSEAAELIAESGVTASAGVSEMVNRVSLFVGEVTDQTSVWAAGLFDVDEVCLVGVEATPPRSGEPIAKSAWRSLGSAIDDRVFEFGPVAVVNSETGLERAWGSDPPSVDFVSEIVFILRPSGCGLNPLVDLLVDYEERRVFGDFDPVGGLCAGAGSQAVAVARSVLPQSPFTLQPEEEPGFEFADWSTIVDLVDLDRHPGLWIPPQLSVFQNREPGPAERSSLYIRVTAPDGRMLLDALYAFEPLPPEKSIDEWKSHIFTETGSPYSYRFEAWTGNNRPDTAEPDCAIEYQLPREGHVEMVAVGFDSQCRWDLTENATP